MVIRSYYSYICFYYLPLVSIKNLWVTKKETADHAAQNIKRGHCPIPELKIGNKIMMNAAEPQLVPTAIGTRSGSIIYGMHNQTTGPRVSPKLAIKITRPIITKAFPTLGEEELIMNPIEMIILDMINITVPNCKRVFLPNFDSK